MIKRILLGIGGTPYTSVAIQRAVELAKRFEAEITGVTVLDLDRLRRAGLAQGKAVPDAMNRVNLVRDRFEEAISAFESTCAAEGIKYQVKQEEKEISFDLMISLARYHDLMIFGLRSIFNTISRFTTFR